MSAPASQRRIPAPQPAAQKIPPLENGDELTRAEFERRYEAMPNLKKAELIDGVVYMPSPVSFGFHGLQHVNLAGWLDVYQAHTPGVWPSADTTLRLNLNNEPQPDLVLFIDPRAGGSAKIDEDKYIVGGPELAVEIASSSVSIDSGRKLKLYQRTKIQEYLLWRVRDDVVDWFVLQGDQFTKMEPGPDGIHRSTVFAGLWLDVAALLSGDRLRFYEVLHQGLATPEHAAFVTKLQKAISPS
jgi:Uma2 family endonuclease